MKALRDVLGEALKRTGSAAALRAPWARVVGEVISRHVQPVRWQGTTLVVRADAPSWKQAVEEELPRIGRALAKEIGESAAVAIVIES